MALASAIGVADRRTDTRGHRGTHGGGAGRPSRRSDPSAPSPPGAPARFLQRAFDGHATGDLTEIGAPAPAGDSGYGATAKEVVEKSPAAPASGHGCSSLVVILLGGAAAGGLVGREALRRAAHPDPQGAEPAGHDPRHGYGDACVRPLHRACHRSLLQRARSGRMDHLAVAEGRYELKQGSIISVVTSAGPPPVAGPRPDHDHRRGLPGRHRRARTRPPGDRLHVGDLDQRQSRRRHQLRADHDGDMGDEGPRRHLDGASSRGGSEPGRDFQAAVTLRLRRPIWPPSTPPRSTRTRFPSGSRSAGPAKERRFYTVPQ